MLSHRCWRSSVFLEAGQEMSACLANIASLAAWTLNLIHCPTPKFLLNFCFQRRHCRFQFPQSHHYFHWCITFMECARIVLCRFSSVLYKNHLFGTIRLLMLRRWMSGFLLLFACCPCLWFRYDWRNGFFNDGLIERWGVLILLHHLCFYQALMVLLPSAACSHDPVWTNPDITDLLYLRGAKAW